MTTCSARPNLDEAKVLLAVGLWRGGCHGGIRVLRRATVCASLDPMVQEGMPKRKRVTFVNSERRFFVASGNSSLSLSMNHDGKMVIYYLSDRVRQRRGGRSVSWSEHRGIAPLVFLDSLFVAIAKALDWMLVMPEDLAKLAWLQTTEYPAHIAKTCREHGEFFASARTARGELVRVVFYRRGEFPAWEISLTRPQVTTLLEWIAKAAGWEIEDLPD